MSVTSFTHSAGSAGWGDRGGGGWVGAGAELRV